MKGMNIGAMSVEKDVVCKFEGVAEVRYGEVGYSRNDPGLCHQAWAVMYSVKSAIKNMLRYLKQS